MSPHVASSHGRRRWRRRFAWIAAASALAVVFIAYQSPHLVVDLANQLWACF